MNEEPDTCVNCGLERGWHKHTRHGAVCPGSRTHWKSKIVQGHLDAREIHNGDEMISEGAPVYEGDSNATEDC